MNQEETTGSILQILTEDLDDGRVIYRSWTHTDPLSVQRNANNVFWTSSAFVARAIQDLTFLGETKWKQKIDNAQAPKGSFKPVLYRPPGNTKMFLFWVQLLGRNGKRIISEFFKKPFWEIFIAKRTEIKNSENSPNSLEHPDWLNASPTRLLLSRNLKKGAYYADPFILEKEGKTYLFLEEYDPELKKGRISVGLLQGETVEEVQPIIEEDWHLSYPFIWEENGEIYLIPESGKAGAIFLYQATNFPWEWEKIEKWFDGEAYDPTVYFENSRYWLFVNQKAHPACSPFDELYLYSSDSFLNPTWEAHPCNPVVSDVRSSRPAGKLFLVGDRLIRPAQDSGKRYGHQISLQEIKILSMADYQEESWNKISPDFERGILGTHTLNFSKNYMVLDAYSRK
jgi:hypothetical protein